jgi:hypothetical protein
MKKQLTILILCWLLASVAFGQDADTDSRTITTIDSFPPSRHKSVEDSLQKVADFEAFKLEKQPIIDSLKKMNSIQYKAIPTIDARGLWVNLALGRSKNRYQDTWRNDSTCDCDGNVIKYDTTWSRKRLIRTAQIQLAYRISPKWGVRAGGQYAWLNVNAGDRVKGLTNKFAYLNQDYAYRNVSSNLSIEHYLVMRRNKFHNRLFLYGGAGVWWQNITETSSINDETSKPINSLMGKKGQDNHIQPFFYMGLRAGIYKQLSYEFGWQQRFFHQVTMSLPLSKNYKKSVERHLQKAEIWSDTQTSLQSEYYQIRLREKLLFPERFPIPKKVEPVINTDDGGGNSSGGNSCSHSKS